MSRDRNLNRILFKYGADVVRQSSICDVEKRSTFVITLSAVKKCPDEIRREHHNNFVVSVTPNETRD
jgi:hypothetical protein